MLAYLIYAHIPTVPAEVPNLSAHIPAITGGIPALPALIPDVPLVYPFRLQCHAAAASAPRGRGLGGTPLLTKIAIAVGPPALANTWARWDLPPGQNCHGCLAGSLGKVHDHAIASGSPPI